MVGWPSSDGHHGSKTPPPKSGKDILVKMKSLNFKWLVPHWKRSHAPSEDGLELALSGSTCPKGPPMTPMEISLLHGKR